MENSINIPKKEMNCILQIRFGSKESSFKCTLKLDSISFQLKIIDKIAKNPDFKLLENTFAGAIVENKLDIFYALIMLCRLKNGLEFVVINSNIGDHIKFQLIKLESKGLLFNSKLDDVQLNGLCNVINDLIIFRNTCFIESFFELTREMNIFSTTKQIPYGMNYLFILAFEKASEYYNTSMKTLEKKQLLKTIKTKEISKSFHLSIKIVESLFASTADSKGGKEKSPVNIDVDEEDFGSDFRDFEAKVKEMAVAKIRSVADSYFNILNYSELEISLEKLDNSDASEHLKSLYKGQSVQPAKINKPKFTDNVFSRKLVISSKKNKTEVSTDGANVVTLGKLRNNDFGDKLKKIVMEEEEEFEQNVTIEGNFKLSNKKANYCEKTQLSYKEVLLAVEKEQRESQLMTPDSVKNVLYNCSILIAREFLGTLIRYEFSECIDFDKSHNSLKDFVSIFKLFFSLRKIKNELEKKTSLVLESKNNLFL